MTKDFTMTAWSSDGKGVEVLQCPVGPYTLAGNHMDDAENNGQPWKQWEDDAMIAMVKVGVTQKTIGAKLGRSERAIQARMRNIRNRPK